MEPEIYYSLDDNSYERLRDRYASDSEWQPRLQKLRVELPDKEGKKFYSQQECKDKIQAIEFSQPAEEILPALKPALQTALLNTQDFTLHLKRYAQNDEVEAVLSFYQTGSAVVRKRRTSYECTIWLYDKISQTAIEGRALACVCFRGEYWSITFRPANKKFKPTTASKPCPEEVKGKPLDSNFLNDLAQIHGQLYDQIFQDPTKEAHGLLVIAGRTGSAKSQLVAGLLKRYLYDQCQNRPDLARTPHILTFEDPIENIPYKTLDEARGQGIDYTPRQKGTDAQDLNEVLENALRQTPTVLFVGETRDIRQWKALLRFAGTGHLIVTTTHAGSLVEAMSTILQATGSDAPSRRSLVAERLLGLVHVRNEEVAGKTVLIPALWRKTPIGAKTLMAEGLSSLLPNYLPEEKKQQGLHSSIGRHWFAHQLTTGRETSLGSDEKAKMDVISKAIEWDLEGI